MTQLEELRARVAKGLAWLAEHDPSSRFHLWYEARLGPNLPLPAHGNDPELRTEYRTYLQARNLFERLSRELDVLDPEWRAKPRREKPPAVIEWKGGKR